MSGPFVVLHHASGLEVARSVVEHLFSTGNLLGLIESPLYSFQPEMVKRYTRRPLTVVLWGMADRYGVGPEIGVDVVTAGSSSDVQAILEGRRLVKYTRWFQPDEDGPGYMSTTGYWLRPDEDPPWLRDHPEWRAA